MERVVGATLLALGLWVFYSLVRFWRGDGEFQLRSLWMLIFAAVRHGWHLLRHRHTGHQHAEEPGLGGFGERSAFGVGITAGLFSVIVGSFFVLGLGDRLPDLQQFFGTVPGGDAP